MRRSAVSPINRESEFRIEELFFSTTDEKGVILSGNDIFVRVSGYSLNELLGEPHNIIRHPDMPRTVFKLLWDYIEGGKSIAAYVKNMAADGSYYWVVALVIPIHGAYLSIRFKPSSPFFAIVQDVYKELRAIEQEYGDRGAGKHDGMQRAAQRLAEILGEKGFKSYDDFMATFLREELKSREQQLVTLGLPITPQLTDEIKQLSLSRHNRHHAEAFLQIFDHCQRIYTPLCGLFSQLDDFVHLNTVLKEKSEFVVQLTRGLKLISLNTAVESTKLGQIGGTLGVIAGHMSDSSRAIEKIVDEVIGKILGLMEQIKGVVFNLAATRLQVEVIMAFCHQQLLEQTAQNASIENGHSIEHVKQMIVALQSAFKATFAQVRDVLLSLQNDLGTLTTGSDVLSKSMLSLQFTQLSGMVEASRLAQETSFGIIFREVRDQLLNANEELGELRNVISKLATQVYEAPRAVKVMDKAIRESDVHIDALAQ